MMDLMDDRNVDGFMDSENECDHKKLLLKKNLSWTNGNSTSLARLNSLKTSRSNPHVLDAVTSNVRSLATSLGASQFIPNRFQMPNIPSTFATDDANDVRHTLAPLTKAVSSSTLAATTTHQTLATPTAIQLNIIQPKYEFSFVSRAILRHCKVNNQLTSYKICYSFSYSLLIVIKKLS